MSINTKTRNILNNDTFNNIKYNNIYNSNYKSNYNIDNNDKKLMDKEEEIMKLRKIISEKDNIILELHLKLKEFRKDIDLLKNKMTYISETAQGKELFNDEILQIQVIQRFNILASENSFEKDENFCRNFKYKKYDDLNLNNINSKNNNEAKIYSINNINKYFNVLAENINNEIDSKACLNLKPQKNYDNNCNEGYANNNFNKNIDENTMNNIKLNSSLFFKKCKALMKNDEYLELLRIIKLFNTKKITKNETYQLITNYLEKINTDLLKEFYNLFVQ